jgi:hypothetical protein
MGSRVGSMRAGNTVSSRGGSRPRNRDSSMTEHCRLVRSMTERSRLVHSMDNSVHESNQASHPDVSSMRLATLLQLVPAGSSKSHLKQ